MYKAGERLSADVGPKEAIEESCKINEQTEMIE
jgi:hypothetical protein